MTDEPTGIRLCTTLFMLGGLLNFVAGMASMAGIDVFHLGSDIVR